MSKDWIADVKKYAPSADDAVLEKMLKNYRLVLTDADAAYVSFSDEEELKTVRENFLKKKLGLTESDEALDAAITQVGEKMKDGTKNGRLAVYYLLAEKYGKLGVFT
ncbi:DUF2853 family protein [Corynebacterium hindlerae]|uniref:DUF2853 family protein n=1 Tax=Corynebacterium hindlerae TaxID=699041 RepID=A0A7G5FC90_9CORY|nr:DUF2853 family protein [Corynebacterium hindlerae]QMV84231.1 DUF2853 family protein [Corynebacterium hindlerae]